MSWIRPERDEAAIAAASAPSFVEVVGSPAETVAHKMAWEMSVAGASPTEVCAAIELEVGFRPTEEQVSGWNRSLRRRAKASLQEAAAHVMLRHNALLNAMLDAWSKRALDDEGAANTVLKTLDRHAKMWGVDAPAKQEIKHQVEPPTLRVMGAEEPEALNEARRLE